MPAAHTKVKGTAFPIGNGVPEKYLEWTFAGLGAEFFEVGLEPGVRL